MRRKKFVQLLATGGLFLAASPYATARSHSKNRDIEANFMAKVEGTHFVPNARLSELHSATGKELTNKGLYMEESDRWQISNGTAFTTVTLFNHAFESVESYVLFYREVSNEEWSHICTYNSHQLKGIHQIVGESSWVKLEDYIIPIKRAQPRFNDLPLICQAEKGKVYSKVSLEKNNIRIQTTVFDNHAYRITRNEMVIPNSNTQFA